jgi:hypothetical protein
MKLHIAVDADDLDLHQVGDLRVRFRARNWVVAGSAVAQGRVIAPDGYKLMSGVICPTSSGGRRAEVTLSYLWVDDKFPKLTLSQAHEHFLVFRSVAAPPLAPSTTPE